MLIAPDAPAPTEIHKIAVTHKKGCKYPGASKRPQMLVKTASVITLGFNKEI